MLACHFWLSICCFSVVQALHNVTIDHLDPAIVYSPAGSWSLRGNYYSGYMLTNDATATAVFTFRGVAVYFASPLPYMVNALVSLDSGPPVLLDLVNRDTMTREDEDGQAMIDLHVIWGVSGLSNTQHQLVISVGDGQPYAVVDTLTYTSLHDPTIPSTAASTKNVPTFSRSISITSQSSASTSPSKASQPPHSRSTTTRESPSPAPASSHTPASSGLSATSKLAISLSTLLSALVLFLTAFGIWFTGRRGRLGHDHYDPGPPAPPPYTRPTTYAS
ncbi:hypothetical protein D9615_010178 [Tricholomella constricta]|uniref:Uncharacterized protein n=1 Tax=Tricholomella constricta TaxID=117010 RepID=A0A8H5LUE5_9AGAR|nr:hypothetical protein D9615_010178 [Tricholomella constricta]